MREIKLSALIELKQVNKTYQLGENAICALDQVDLTVNRGEFLSLMGTSGSGKSSLLNIIGLLDRPTMGAYFFNGDAITNLSEDKLASIRNERIGFVFQSFFLLPRLTALQNVMLPLSYRAVPKKVAQEKALHLLDRMGVASLKQHRPNQLSGGQQQRVAIARALVGDPDLILADEPTGALDSQTSQEVMTLFQELHRREGRTILLITHDAAISRQCERTIMIKDGKIVY